MAAQRAKFDSGAASPSPGPLALPNSENSLRDHSLGFLDSVGEVVGDGIANCPELVISGELLFSRDGREYNS